MIDTTSARHLARETGTLDDPHAYHAAREQQEYITLAELAARGGRVTRLRLLTEVWGGMGRLADLSYCHGVLPDGTPVSIIPTHATMGVPLRKMKGHLIEWAKEEGVFAKGLGLLDEGNWSILY